MKTPVSSDGLRRYDSFDPLFAIALAWTVAGLKPRWHRRAQKVVRKAMPLLARALDRLVEDFELRDN